MTAVYVLTAGSGDTYRIERVYLDSDEAHRFAHDYNGIARRELAGVPRVEVVGLSKEKVEELFWDTITQVRADVAGVARKELPLFRVADGTKRVYQLDIAAHIRHDDCMDRRALERLGHHVVSRRVALGYRNRTDLADSLQFTVRTLADIEHGVRKASPGTYAMLENTLAWAPGSIVTILADGEPDELVVKQRRTTHNPLAHTATEAPSRASTEELLLELRRRIIAPGNTRSDTWDDWDGLDAHGDWPEQG